MKLEDYLKRIFGDHSKIDVDYDTGKPLEIDNTVKPDFEDITVVPRRSSGKRNRAVREGEEKNYKAVQWRDLLRYILGRK